MLTDRLRQRLEQIHRHSPSTTSPEVAQGTVQSAPHIDAQQVVNDRTALAGEELTTAWGPHLLLRQSIDALWPASHRYLADRMDRQLDDRDVGDHTGVTTTSPRHHGHANEPAQPTKLPESYRSRRDHGTALPADGNKTFTDDLTALQQSFPRRAVYLDLETCGFAGSMVFLAGLLHWHDGRLVLSQLWARNYAEEKAILQSLWTILAENDLLITFNGKSFDWPQVHDRSTLHHLGYRTLTADESPSLRLPFESDGTGLAPTDPRPEPWHVDLLHHARRRWRHQLPNCRLQTLERYLCGRHRVGDLAGSKIPEAYHEYVRSGRIDEAQAILHHNALDLVTLLQLALLFLD